MNFEHFAAIKHSDAYVSFSSSISRHTFTNFSEKLLLDDRSPFRFCNNYFPDVSDLRPRDRIVLIL